MTDEEMSEFAEMVGQCWDSLIPNWGTYCPLGAAMIGLPRNQPKDLLLPGYEFLHSPTPKGDDAASALGIDVSLAEAFMIGYDGTECATWADFDVKTFNPEERKMYEIGQSFK